MPLYATLRENIISVCIFKTRQRHCYLFLNNFPPLFYVLYFPTLPRSIVKLTFQAMGCIYLADPGNRCEESNRMILSGRWPEVG